MISTTPLDDIFAVIAAVSNGDTEARIPVPAAPQPEDLVTLVMALNHLLDTLTLRTAQLEATYQAAQLKLERLVAARTEQLRQSEEKFSKAFRSSPAAISIATLPEGRWIEINDALANMIGYSSEDLLGHTSSELGLVDSVARAKILEAIHEHGAVRNVEIQLHTKSQALVDVLVSVEQIEINGQACALTIQYDITEFKHAQQEVQRLNNDLEQRQRVLEATNKELEVFSHSIAHDLRVPLRIIDRFSQLLFEDYYDRLDDTGREYLQHARAASQQMGQLIDALLNLSRINRSELTKEEINLSQLAQEITSGLQTGQPEREVEFILQEGLTAHANRSLVHVALENLIRNAWKSTRDQSPARIEFGMTQAIDEQIYFVRDNGTDFDLKYANKVFDASQNLHDLKALAGTRIGLAATQRIIHRHGGRIWAESDVNQGAIFYFTL